MAVHGRRTFLRVVAGASVACAACSSDPGAGPASFGDVAAGNVSSLSAGSILAIAGSVAFIARDANGLYAMTTTCTHQGCNLATQGSIGPNEISCGCHGSVFNGNGDVVQGPAEHPLQHFAVTVDGSGNITVHGGTEVAESVRVVV